jgi:adenine-specific DNA-methyltransferase
MTNNNKELGAYFTPPEVAEALVRWAVCGPADLLLDPSCGDGRFLVPHANSVGIEIDAGSVAVARARAPGARVINENFFAWARSPLAAQYRFDCVVGNPPFIRYQTFSGEARALAQQYCASLGVHFSGLSSSWAPFLVTAASLLKTGGKLSFVVPAEIGHAPYAAPLLEYLIARFSVVHVVAFQKKIFPQLSEDCWLLYAEGFGGETREIRFSALPSFVPRPAPPDNFQRISVTEWRTTARRRLRPYLLSPAVRQAYFDMGEDPEVRRLSSFATIGIGYVSGANDFFHIRPSEARQRGIPERFLQPAVRNGRVLKGQTLTTTVVENWLQNDQPILLLRLPRQGQLPKAVRDYLSTDAAVEARTTYKCRTREPWYSVPDVRVPDFFLSYMSGMGPSLVENAAGCTCTNSVHAVKLKEPAYGRVLRKVWRSQAVQLSCELEGHPLGGGMLKLELGEAQQIVIPARSGANDKLFAEGVREMRSWRHATRYDVRAENA